MINEVLAAVHHLLPERLFILLPNSTDPELVIYSEEFKAVVRTDETLPVFVVMSRQNGKLITWGEGRTVLDAAQQAVHVLELSQPSRIRKAA